MLPGFSDDNESGEELPGDLMVTGRGIKHVPAAPGDRHEATSATKAQAPGMEGLMVSGIKVTSSAIKDTDFEFPGFSSSQKEPTVTPMHGMAGQGSGVDLPLDM